MQCSRGSGQHWAEWRKRRTRAGATQADEVRLCRVKYVLQHTKCLLAQALQSAQRRIVPCSIWGAKGQNVPKLVGASNIGTFGVSLLTVTGQNSAGIPAGEAHGPAAALEKLSWGFGIVSCPERRSGARDSAIDSRNRTFRIRPMHTKQNAC